MCDLISKQLLGVSIAAALIFTATGCDSSSTTTKISRQALPESIQNLSFDKHLYIGYRIQNSKPHSGADSLSDPQAEHG